MNKLLIGHVLFVFERVECEQAAIPLKQKTFYNRF